MQIQASRLLKRCILSINTVTRWIIVYFRGFVSTFLLLFSSSGQHVGGCECFWYKKPTLLAIWNRYCKGIWGNALNIHTYWRCYVLFWSQKYVEALKVRLQLARFKLQHGWEKLTLSDIDNLCNERQQQQRPNGNDKSIPQLTQQYIIETDDRAGVIKSLFEHNRCVERSPLPRDADYVDGLPQCITRKKLKSRMKMAEVWLPHPRCNASTREPLSSLTP